MPMNQEHGRVWKKITDVYQQWDQDRSNLMAIDDLSQRLPDIDPGLIIQTLAEAEAEGKAAASDEGGTFRPVPNY
ncbi:hypothetical protein [Noviherbaspirillum saxi]|uniref:Uncharacterized protein n=1 Tax=Noviherbaspirillum saxi TaxID=2320863 RepID=A0A3A3FU15_9BURK|nr:hypothetical protein [Noviherbaspirillum saxi]RJF99283.1 hypothetical protein D3871_12695 [Noviherbaspirillum saxi]